MPTPAAIRRKLARLRSSNPPRFMDLFSGCGGITLGFTSAGFEIVGSVELDKWAADSHGANFSRFSHGKNSHAKHVSRDITKEDAASVLDDLGITGPVEEQVDVLVGGPPCQAFARIGRAKLRHEALRRKEDDADIAFLVDGRVNLWKPYLKYVQDTKPLALLMENVPDILNHGGRNVAETVAEQLRNEGYRVRYTLLNASWFGVPQMRERMFLIGLHEAVEADIEFPSPTHYAELPVGYDGTRAAARKLIASIGSDEGSFEHVGHRWVDDPTPEQDLPSTTTAREALADLPAINALDLLRKGAIARGRKDPSETSIYASLEPSTAWSKLMRRWPEFGTDESTTGHVIRYLPRDYKIFRLMEEGWEYPDVWRFVEERRRRLINAYSRRATRNGNSADLRELEHQWTLPYDPEKFPNKWWKINSDKPVRTLMAHLGKDSYSHIHFDSSQARTISVREAARLQSFPDGFILRGSMNPAFRQIGNAVPSLVAYAIAMAMRSMLGCQRLRDIRCDLLGLDRKHIRSHAGKDRVCTS